MPPYKVIGRFCGGPQDGEIHELPPYNYRPPLTRKIAKPPSIDFSIIDTEPSPILPITGRYELSNCYEGTGTDYESWLCLYSWYGWDDEPPTLRRDWYVPIDAVSPYPPELTGDIVARIDELIDEWNGRDEFSWSYRGQDDDFRL